MENPEAFLDILTLRSLKERYHGGSESDDNEFSLDTMSIHDDLETFVRDFRIDDSISDCFADSDSLVSADIGVECKPSSKAPIPAVQDTTADLGLNSPETLFHSEVAPEFSPCRRQNIVTSLFQKRLKQNETGEAGGNQKNVNKIVNNVDRFKDIGSQKKLNFDNENLETFQKPIKTNVITLERDAEVENINASSNRITEHSQKSNHGISSKEKEPHLPKICPNKSNTEGSNLDPHQTEHSKHEKLTKKFGLGWVWSNTLKKCKRKVPSSRKSKEQFSQSEAGVEGNDNDSQEDKQVYAPFADHQGLSWIKPEIDFDEININRVQKKLHTQFQAKSEPNLGQKEVMNKTLQPDMHKRRSEGFVYDPGEHFNGYSEARSSEQKNSSGMISSKLSQSSALDLIASVHISPYSLNNSNFPASLDQKSHLPCHFDQSEMGLMPDPTVDSLLKSDPTFGDTNRPLPDSSNGYWRTEKVGQENRSCCMGRETQEVDGLSPAVERCLLEMINRELVKRAMVTHTQLVRLSNLVLELVSKFNGSDIIETLATASSQLKLLSQSPQLHQDLSSFVEQTNLELQRTSVFLLDYNSSVMRLLDQLRQPIELKHCGYRAENCKENQLQIRSLLLEAYDLAKQRPQDLSQQLQLLISLRLNSGVDNASFLSVNEPKSNRPGYPSMEAAAIINERPLLPSGHGEQHSSKHYEALVPENGIHPSSQSIPDQAILVMPNGRKKLSVLNPDDKYPQLPVGMIEPDACVSLTAETSDTTSTITSDVQTVIYVKHVHPDQRADNSQQYISTLMNQQKISGLGSLRPYSQPMSLCKEQEPRNEANFESLHANLKFSSGTHGSHRWDVIHSSGNLKGHMAGTEANSTLINSSRPKYRSRSEHKGSASQSKTEKTVEASRRKHYENARRSRRKRRRSLSETRYVRRKHNLSLTTASTSSTRSTERSELSGKRRYGHSLRVYSSSRSASARLQKNYVDDCWSDDESDDEDDDDDDTKRLVRVNVENEDLPDEALRIQRLHRHLQSVQKLHQCNEDIIETIITGTGEKLVPHALSHDPSMAPNIDGSHGSLPLRTSEMVNTHSGTNTSSAAARKQNVSQRFPKIKKLLGPHLFNHEKMAPQRVPMREMTESEFEETYERRNDVTVRRRKQMDMGIPWDQLKFSESDESDAHENQIRNDSLAQKNSISGISETVRSSQREFF